MHPFVILLAGVQMIHFAGTGTVFLMDGRKDGMTSHVTDGWMIDGWLGDTFFYVIYLFIVFRLSDGRRINSRAAMAYFDFDQLRLCASLSLSRVLEITVKFRYREEKHD